MTKKRPNEWYVAYVIDPDGVRHEYHRKTYERHWLAPGFAVLYLNRYTYRHPGLQPAPRWSVRKWTHTFWKAEEVLKHYLETRPDAFIVPVLLERQTRTSKHFQKINGRDMIIL